MGRIHIVTDNVACIPEDVLRRLEIVSIPVYLIFENRSYRDTELSPEEFYRMLEGARKPPTTSSPSLGDYLTTFQQVQEGAEAIVCFTYSNKLGSALSTATVAATQFSGVPVHVVDTLGAGMAQGFVVMAAARAAQEGKDLEGVMAAAAHVMPRVHVEFVLDTLEYLHRGGRAPAIAAWLTSLLNIKLVLHLVNGAIVPLTQVRTQRRALQRIIDKVDSRRGSATSLHAAVHHAAAPEQAHWLREQLTRRFPCVELYVTEIPSPVAVHTGPGAAGVAYYWD